MALAATKPDATTFAAPYAAAVNPPNSILLTTAVVPIKLPRTMSAFKFAVLKDASLILISLFASTSGV